jgi:hypothetical protein
MSIEHKFTPEKMRDRAALQFQDMEVQYGRYLRDHPHDPITFKQYIPKVYCAPQSPHPARFAEWYHSTHGGDA